MEIIIPKKESPVKTDTGITYNPLVKITPGCKLSVLRTELNEKFTRIDFIYQATSYYINGGWVRIHDTCFIRPVGSDLKLRMIKAVNIPIAPKRHWFKTSKDMLCYTLYFPPLPAGTKTIDIIEMETNDPSFFNFYGVSVERIKTEVINVGN